jgi:hypothetical protein
MEVSGRSGIRTHERVAPLTVFKTVAFVRSAILPEAAYVSPRRASQESQMEPGRLVGVRSCDAGRPTIFLL